MLLWTIFFWASWFLTAWLFWSLFGLETGLAALALFTLLELVFPIPLLRPRARNSAGRLLEWLGILSAALLGALLGVAAIWSLLVFRGGFESAITGVGALIGLLVLGWTYAAGARKQETIARDDTLTGLLFGVFAVSLVVLVLVWLSRTTTAPEWLFRFPENEGVRTLWGRAGYLAFIIILWTAGTTFVAGAIRNRPTHRVRRV